MGRWIGPLGLKHPTCERPTVHDHNHFLKSCKTACPKKVAKSAPQTERNMHAQNSIKTKRLSSALWGQSCRCCEKHTQAAFTLTLPTRQSLIGLVLSGSILNGPILPSLLEPYLLRTLQHHVHKTCQSLGSWARNLQSLGLAPGAGNRHRHTGDPFRDAGATWVEAVDICSPARTAYTGVHRLKCIA